MTRRLPPFRDAEFHGEMQGHLQTFIRWTVAPDESPTGHAPSDEMIQDTARITAEADPNGGRR